jgi:hypothetical protein
MTTSRERVYTAFAHEETDRTPLFELFQTCHPIHWDVCGRNIATDMEMQWDALAEGVAWEELVEAQAQAKFKMAKYFGLDIVHANANPGRDGLKRPEKIGNRHWRLDGIDYVYNDHTKLVVVENPAAVAAADSEKVTEEDRRRQIENWDGSYKKIGEDRLYIIRRVRELAAEEGIEWSYMAEGNAGTHVSSYPPFQLMWIVLEPELIEGWLAMKKAAAFHHVEALAGAGCDIYAFGGDCSSDKGPMLSPQHYHDLILPTLQEHVAKIHECGAKAVYTADGNHWAIKDDFFYGTGCDGYKEVDFAAGMTMDRLVDEGIKDRVCIIGGMDARYTMCTKGVEDVKRETKEVLDLGRKTPGGHILHLSHSVHEDVKTANYIAMVNTYREYFGMEKLG